MKNRLFSTKIQGVALRNLQIRAESTNPKLSLVEGAKAYAKLRREVTAAGILDRDYKYYAIMAIFAFGGFILSAFFIYISSSLLLVTLLCLGFTFFAIQVEGFLHDSSHHAIFKSIKNNDRLGYFSAALLGIFYKAWKKSHNEHHANPNIEDKDPDIGMPLLSLNKKRYKNKIGKMFLKNQTYFYYPLGSLLFTTLKIWSFGFGYLKENFKQRDYTTLVFYLLGLCLWFIVPFLVFSLAKAILVSVSVNLMIGIYMSNIFAPNHKGMPRFKKEQKISFLEHQIITSRNTNGGFITDIMLLGLNYQIEHHLFTNCPRNKLKLITPYVKKLCRELNLEYTEVGLVETNKIILGELQKGALATS